ncbi:MULTISPECIES: SAM-dependent methyltransferase [Nocardia]|uniref:Methyltransferase n=1 Tax=Nocardia asteroides NBRC 15531 TaxID=1110697 RepID=U5EIE3_NOCAS|nr:MULTISPECIES: SAM-dependent methyltransferase [Nocardia]UGT47205.1 SAM-dependent methyltransferase [Nocardia asteroides]GAD87070.1 hypothetical protein NCAST_34_01980 [Nocardia asteroides NBRC 15531]SFM76423.1 S-adenosyl methyltransferase [Nocardia asteroides]VEG33911.1 S-adenosyl methyltransferase [Nocardia asteroides]
MTNHEVALRHNMPSSARVVNKLLGGKDNYEIDGLVAANISNRFVVALREGRRFLLRAVDYLSSEHAVHQYVDLGCGIAMPPDVGDAATHRGESARVLYLDNDPLVAVHARALLATNPNRHFALLDITDTAAVLDKIAAVFDLNAPFAVCLSGTAEHLPEAPTLLAELTAGLPPGTWIVFSHITDDVFAHAIGASARELGHHGIAYHPRDRDTLATMLAPYQLLHPGLIAPHRWHPITRVPALKPQHPLKHDLAAYAAVGQRHQR